MEYFKHKLKRRGLFNCKESMKFYINKEIYDLFDYTVFYKNSFSFEFYTLNKDYKKIFDYFKEEFDARLICCEWDNNYNCYCVDISCVPLMVWLEHWNCKPWISSGESNWKSMARERGWFDEDDLDKGWSEYKQRIDNWFKRNY